MSLRESIGPGSVAVGLKAASKAEAIDRLIELLVAGGKLRDADAAREAVLARERKMSTGMKNGIAIPHGKTDAVDGLVACLAISEEPIDFESLDGLPSRIFIMTLSPPSKTGPHLQFLAEVSQLFKSPERRQALLDARTPEALLDALYAR